MPCCLACRSSKVSSSIFYNYLTSSLDAGWCETYWICNLLKWSVQSLGGNIESIISKILMDCTLLARWYSWICIFLGFKLVVLFHGLIYFYAGLIFDQWLRRFYNFPLSYHFLYWYNLKNRQLLIICKVQTKPKLMSFEYLRKYYKIINQILRIKD